MSKENKQKKSQIAHGPHSEGRAGNGPRATFTEGDGLADSEVTPGQTPRAEEMANPEKASTQSSPPKPAASRSSFLLMCFYFFVPHWQLPSHLPFLPSFLPSLQSSVISLLLAAIGHSTPGFCDRRPKASPGRPLPSRVALPVPSSRSCDSFCSDLLSTHLGCCLGHSSYNAFL